MDDHNFVQANECYKRLNRHMICSECNNTELRNYYRKRRTVCKLYYNNQVLAYYKNESCPNSPTKSNVITQTDLTNKQDVSREQDSSRKQDISSKQDRSNK